MGDITNPNVNYNQDYFENVILKNFDHPENLLKLDKETNFMLIDLLYLLIALR